MELNSAMFSRANRLGYVLKPEYLRQKGPEKDKVAALRSEKYRLDIEVRSLLHSFRFLHSPTVESQIISAQQLPRPRSADNETANLDPFVEVSLFVPGVIAPQKRRTHVVLYVPFSLLAPSPLTLSSYRGNAFNPSFSCLSSVSGTLSSPAQFSLTFSSHPSPGMLDLVFVRFEVLNAKGNLKAAAEEGKGESVGAYAISVGALMPGPFPFLLSTAKLLG
jgi:phosphatidylinositol phospholipase C delta